MKLPRTTVFRGLVACVPAFLAVSAAFAAPVTTPADLGAGDRYRLVFVSSAKHNAESADVTLYNSFLDALGTAATGTSGWKVIGSTAAEHARDNTETDPTNPAHDSVPVYLLDGATRIADDNADLWDGTLDAAINLNEAGNLTLGTVWTGTQTDGTAAGTARLGDAVPVVGNNNFATGFWIDWDTARAFNTHHLYAISGVLTVAGPPAQAPEPGPLGALGVGLLALVLARRSLRAVPSG